MSMLMNKVAGAVVPERQRGFTLIEVLVALLILSIGLLGVAGVQMMSLKMDTQATARSKAVMLTYDMADRIRASKDASGNVNAAYGSVAINAAPTASPTACNSSCTGSTLANWDISMWKCQLGGYRTACAAWKAADPVRYKFVDYGLPGGKGSISSVTAGGRTTYTITVQWLSGPDDQCTTTNGPDTVCQFVLEQEI